MSGAPELLWDVQAQLGEGPVWTDDALWFVDIKKQLIHCLDYEGSGQRSWDAPEQVGFIVPSSKGGFVVGLQSGLYRFDPRDSSFTSLAEVEPDLPTNRLNDGVVDPSGRLWFGTMDNGERAKTGAFYRFERDGLFRTGIEKVAITNGPAISPDGRTLYWVDTRAGKVWACSIAEDGRLSDSKPFVRLASTEGHPDGPTIDAEGCVWISLYAGWEARRYSPSGELLDRVRFPVANITKIAFGGPDLRTAYATTARQLLSAEELERQPLAGGLFGFQVDVPGLPCPSAAT